MKLSNVTDIEDFWKTIDKCQGSVWLESANGDRLDLKSVFSRYLAIGKLIEDRNEELELFASDRADESMLMQFLKNRD
jgi:hypothetical protein